MNVIEELVLVAFGLLLVVAPAAAQTMSQPEPDHFIQGSWFADLRTWDWPGTPRAGGGSVAIGWNRGRGRTFELQVDVPQFAEWFSERIGPGGPAGTDAPLMGSRRRQQSRIMAVAVLWGFSSPSNARRVGARKLVGFGLMVSEKRFRDESWLVDTPAQVTVLTEATHGAAPVGVIGIDGRIRLSRRVQLVPGTRLFVSYVGYVMLILRPAVGVLVNF